MWDALTGDSLFDYALLGLAAALAGTVDAVIGGGGMVQVPALFAVYPTVTPAMLLGTGKISSVVGTSGAAVQYVRFAPTNWAVAAPAAIVSFLAAVAGAYAVLLVPAEPLRKALPFVLLALLAYTLRSRIGLEHLPRHSRSAEITIASAGSTAVDFYDGFLGAGTGAFYKLMFVRGLGYDFLNAAAPSKIANVASNLGALLVFVLAGQMMWSVGLWMAVANFAGGQVGSRLAIRYGSDFIRRCFIVVVACLITKTFYDAYLR